MRITPNFNFDGQCEEALNLYQKAFHGNITCLLRYEDAKKEDWSRELTEEQKRYIYHAELLVGEQRIMMCDNLDVDFVTSLALSLTLTFDTKEEVIQAYEVMKEGSKTIYPIQETTYSSCMVVFVDRFGFRWGLMTEN
ncbi:VOC family protein [Anaerosporobacter faecicola]|uniref:VOC family protein n=1 Tax=Anaerosporobacter faecicola TaxID=2718714 RepID=UPI001EE573A5|nr:VOC family protein [Anaerosporobacter faecicola]